MVLKLDLKILLPVLFLMSMVNLSAQDDVKLKELINTALDENYQIRIVKNNREIAENSNTIGNAGMLPDVSIIGEKSWSSSNTNQEFLTGDVQNRDNALSEAATARLDVNWIVFDGLAMFARKNQLEQLEQQSKDQTRFYIEQTTFDLATTYFRLKQESRLLDTYRQSLVVSQSRLDYEKRAFDLGSSTGLDVAQARVDRNTDSSMVLTQKALIRELNIELNRILNRELTETIEPVDTIRLTPNFDLVGLMDDVKSNNAELNSQQMNELIALSESNIAKGALFPEVELFGSYSYNDQSSEAGFLRTSRSYGPDFGIRVRFNLFSGSQERIRSENLKIESESEALRTDELSKQLEASTRIAYLRWQSRVEQTDLERKSVKAAMQALKIAEKQYEAGTLTNVDFRVIQLNAVNARSRFLEAQFAAKTRELQLYRLSGNLMNNLLQ